MVAMTASNPTIKGFAEKRGAIVARAKSLKEKIESRALGVTDEDRPELTAITEDLAGLDKAESDYRSLRRISDIADPSLQPRYLSDPSKDNPFNRLNDYRMLRAFDRLAQGKMVNGIEGEIHDVLVEEARDHNIQTNGNLRIPHTLPMGEQRATTNTTTAVGALQSSVANTFIDVLRNSLVLRRAGAQVASNLIGTFSLPKKTNKLAGAWVGEDTAPAAGTALTFGQAQFVPKNVSSEVIVGRDLTKQTSLDMENIARKDVLLGIAEAIDYAGWHGSGSSNMPQGIASNSACPLISLGTNGGHFTRAKAIECLTAIRGANVDSSLQWVTGAVGYGDLINTLMLAGSTVPIFLADDNKMLGMPIQQSNQIRTNMTKGSATAICSGVFFGDFTQLVIGLWGSADLLVDMTSNKPAMTIDVWQTADIVIRQPLAIAKVLDLLYS